MPDVVLGNNLASLVASVEGVLAGKDVVLISDGRPLGGHFRGLDAGGHLFDLGRVLVERADQGVRAGAARRREGDQGWTAWAPAVDEVLQRHTDLRRAPTPEVHVLGRRWPDHLVSNRLDVMTAPGLPRPPAMSPADPLHARHKMLPGAYDTLDYGAAAAANHGRDLHDLLFEPFVRKLMGVSSSSMLARAHRYAWVPLYWPESLTAAADGRDTGLAEYPFWTTASGCTADLVRDLERMLRSHPRALVVDAPADAVRRGASGWDVVVGGRCWSGASLVLGTSPARASELFGTPQPTPRTGADVGLILCTVAESALRAPSSCLFVTESDDPVYRISDHEVLAGKGARKHRVVVEVSGAAEGSVKALESLRRHLGVTEPDAIEVLRTLRVPGAKPVPTPALVEAMHVERNVFHEAAPGVVLTGSLVDHASSSLNDQIVQGWRAVHQELAAV